MGVTGVPRRSTLTAIVLAATVIAAGCGADGPSNAEFTAEANAICKRHNDTISAAASKVLAGGKLPSPREFGQLAQQTIVPEISAQVGELKEIEAPEDKSGAYDAWLDDSEALKTKLEGDPSLIQNPQALAAVNAQADRLGLSDKCHVGPG